MNQVVNDDDLREISILDDPEILDSKPVFGFQTVLPSQKALNVIFIGVEVIDDRFGIFMGGRGEDVDLEMFTDGVKEHFAEWTDIEPDFVSFGVDFYLVFFIVFHGMNEGFIQIEHQKLLLVV